MADKIVEHTEMDDGSQQVTVHTGNILQSVTRWHPKDIELIYGVTLPADAPDELFRKVRAYTDTYTKARCLMVDDYINRRVSLCGAMMHPATFSYKHDKGDPQIIDSETGEVQEYKHGYRQVVKVCAVDGKDCQPFFISFGSAAIEQEFIETLLPRYGSGDWDRTLDVVFESVRTSVGRKTYNMRIVE